MTKPKTWSGDDGFTDILGKGRVEKSSLRVECLGALDESSAALGLAKSFCADFDIQQKISRLQKTLYCLMSEAAATKESIDNFPGVSASDVKWLEEEVRSIENSVKIPDEFILPGSTRFSAALDVARTTIRRAERRLVDLNLHGEYENTEGLKFINRLSTLIFYLEIREIISQPNPGNFKAKQF
jgi:cob(I)alamin adenosyltransferase